MRRLTPAVFALLLVLLVARAPAAQAAPATAGPLFVSTDVTYDVRPGDGPVHVTWHVSVQNNDPSTAYREFGTIYFYFASSVPLLRGAQNVSAVSEAGVPLSVSVEDVGFDLVTSGVVQFDRNLHYGDSYSYTLSYDITSVRDEIATVTPFYARLPMIAYGDTSTVRAITPEGDGWQTTLDWPGCPSMGPQEYNCSSPDVTMVAALVEVVLPTALEDATSRVAVAAREVDLTVRHFPGDEAWAAHVEDLTRRALPALEELFGVPFPADAVLIEARGGQDLFGHAGIFECDALLRCEVGVSLVPDDHVLLHELAHFWTTRFRDRWMQEGLAELMARHAAARLGLPQPPDDYILGGHEPVVYALQLWPAAISALGATEEARVREASGYERSLAFFRLLEERIGLEGLQQAQRAVFEDTNAGTREYFDIIEEGTGVAVEDLFRSWVLTGADLEQLDERRAARDRLVALEAEAVRLGLEPPRRVRALVESWTFGAAQTEMAKAERAMEEYARAERAVQDSGGWLARFGLYGRDAGTLLEEASGAFQAGRLEESAELAGRAAELADGAERTGLYRLAVASSMFGVLALALAWALLRRRRAP